MQTSFSSELARSLVVMLLEMQAEIRELSYHMDLEEKKTMNVQSRSGSTGSLLNPNASCRAASKPG